MAEIDSLASIMSETHLDTYNQYFGDSKYKKLVEMNAYSLELDSPDKFMEMFACNPLATLLEIPNRYCYQHFNDEDISYAKMSISPLKMDRHAATYQNVMARGTNPSAELDVEMSRLKIAEDVKVYGIHDDNIEIYAKMYELFMLCVGYFGNPSMGGSSAEIVRSIPPDFIDQIRNLISQFQYEVILNPLNPTYHMFNELQIEIMIMINLAAIYLKIANRWCATHNVGFHQLEAPLQRKYLRFLNNYLALIFEIAFCNE